MKDFQTIKTGRFCPVQPPLYRGVLIFLFAACLAGLTGCKSDSFTISGRIDGVKPDEYLLLREVKPGILEPVDSMIPDRDGKFRFRSGEKWPAFYMLSLGNDDFMTLLVTPGEKIEVKAAKNTLALPEYVKGSDGTAVMVGFSKEHREVINELQRLTDIYNDSIDSPGLPLLMDSLDRRAADIVSVFRDKAMKLLDDNKSSMVSVYLLNQQVVPGLQLFEAAKNPEIFYRVDSALYALYPESDLVLDLHNFVAGLRRSVTVAGKPGTNPVPGDMLPDIALPDVNGDTVRLSTIKGRVVLVDFWAAWCPPCREENPNLVRMYDQWHNRGFNIFQVSLDLRKEDWTEAIRKDRLGRWTHVSDLKYRDSEVVKRFGLTEIPSNFLIDGEGKVIAVNVRGDDLNKKLEELLGGQ
jgi:peroxiredoxin